MEDAEIQELPRRIYSDFKCMISQSISELVCVETFASQDISKKLILGKHYEWEPHVKCL
jgi:hypothetical protein